MNLPCLTTRAVILAAGTLLLLMPAAAHAQNRYAALEIHNSTSNVTIYYHVRWGPDGAWGDKITLRPGRYWCHWWSYPVVDQNRSPVPQIRFVTGINRPGIQKLYDLVAYASPLNNQGGNKYFFERHADASGEDSIDLYSDTRASARSAPAAPAANRQLGGGSSPAVALTNEGFTLYSRGQYDQAIAKFTQAIQADPRYGKAYYNRGRAYYQKHYYDMAIADCSTAVGLDNSLADAYNVRGLAYYGKQYYDQAIADQTQALRLLPDSHVFLANRGNAYHAKSYFDQAIADFTAALRYKPDLATYHNYLGVSLSMMRQYDRAIAEFTTTIRLDPTFALAYSNRGAAYFHKQATDEAIQDFTTAISLNPKLSLPYWWRGQAYARLGERAKAKADYDTTVALDPSKRQMLKVAPMGGPTPVFANRPEALAALRAFRLGSTISAAQLSKWNTGPAMGDPLEKRADAVPKEVKELIKMEMMRREFLEFEMMAAANKVLRAAKLSAADRKAQGLDLTWLYGSVTSPFRRDYSGDDLGGMRLIAHLVLPDGQEINGIFPMTYYPFSKGDDGGGEAGLLAGGDNFRIEARFFTTGVVASDYAHQSFHVDDKGGRMQMAPGFYIDETTGMLINKNLATGALGTKCFDCHRKGPRLKASDLQLMKLNAFTQMKGFKKFLEQAEILGATQPDLEKLRALMAKDPAGLLPIDNLLRANEEQWLKRYTEYRVRLEGQRRDSARPELRLGLQSPFLRSNELARR